MYLVLIFLRNFRYHTEEERKRREAQNAGTGIGLAVGVIAGVILSADVDDGEDDVPTMKM